MPEKMIRERAPSTELTADQIRQMAPKVLNFLMGYYGADPKSSNVKEFYLWFSANSDRLVRGFYEAAKSGKIEGDVPKNPLLLDGSLDPKFLVFFGCYIGMNYVAEKMGGDESPNFPKITDKTKYPTAFYSFLNHQIEINMETAIKDFTSLGARFIDAINLGIREGAHGLAMMGGTHAELTEIVTLRAQTELALPLKIADLNGMLLLSGTRDFTQFVDEYKSASDPRVKNALQRAMLGDYFASTITHWITKYTENGKVFGFEYSGDDVEHISGVNLFKVWMAYMASLPSQEEREKAAGRGPDGIPGGTGNGEKQIDASKLGEIFKKTEDLGGLHARFVSEEGIGEKSELALKLKKVFDGLGNVRKAHPEIGKAEMADFGFFLKEFYRLMTEEFGEPKKGDTPHGYVYRQDGKEVENGFWAG
ncbi:MAG: hypothetical protein NTX79_03100 [Candidatus Micrarchaeota archaeon]|nr:hypothetical protein [Candidatus Micrarchaeota archaeon]